MKASSTLFSLLALAGAALSGVFYYLADSDGDRLRATLQQAQSELSESRRQLAALEEEATQLRESLDAKKASLEETQANATLLTARNRQLRREAKRLGEELEERIAHEESLRREIASLESELADTRANSVSLEQVAEYEKTIARLEAQALRQAQTRPGFAPQSAPAAKAAAAPAPADLSGRILTVGPGASFVVLDRGYLDGLRLDHLLAIERDGTAIANARVTEVKENLSIAQLLPNSVETEPRPGDAVTTPRNKSNL